MTKYDNLQFVSTRTDGRRAVERSMTSTCRITRPGDRTFNSSAGDYTDGAATVVYEGKCRFKAFSPIGQRTGNVAEREMTSTLYDLALPWGEYDISVSDTVEVSGKNYPVISIDHGENRTAVHITVVNQDTGTVTYA